MKKVNRMFNNFRANKKGDMNLSFGMIFSIILIVIFISFAFYAIQKFLDIQNSAQVGKFSSDFQASVNSMWKGSEGSQSEQYFLPSKIKNVCFIDYESGKRGKYQEFYGEFNQVFYGDENMFFQPVGSAQGFDSIYVRNINVEAITEENNPFCIGNTNGKVNIRLKKNFGEALVTVSE